jgi:hypothetical protein
VYRYLLKTRPFYLSLFLYYHREPFHTSKSFTLKIYTGNASNKSASLCSMGIARFYCLIAKSRAEMWLSLSLLPCTAIVNCGKVRPEAFRSQMEPPGISSLQSGNFSTGSQRSEYHGLLLQVTNWIAWFSNYR